MKKKIDTPAFKNALKIKNKEIIIEAFRYAEKNLLLSKIHELKKLLYNQYIFIPNTIITKYIFSTGHDNLQFSISQNLNITLLNHDFNIQILCFLYTGKKIKYPLPFQYIKILEENNIKVNKFISNLKYFKFVLYKFTVGVKENLLAIKKIFFEKNSFRTFKSSILFADIALNSIPNKNDNNIYNIINWYIENRNQGKIEEIRHNISSIKEFKKSNFSISPDIEVHNYINTFKLKLNFLIWSFITFFYFFFLLITFQFKSILLYQETILSKLYKIVKKDYLPIEIYFSISSFLNKPLWSFICEDRGVNVFQYSWASSFLGFKTSEGYIDKEYFFQNTKWKNILVWSNDYFYFIKNRVPNDVNIELIKPLYFSDSNFKMPKVKANSISIFDVTPLEEYINFILLPDDDYRNYKNAINFLNDIYEAAILFDFTIFWKRKRNFHMIHNNKYIEFCNEFSERNGVITVDPDASAFKVIKECDICISLPFTSTALIAKDLKKKSIYYDPSGLLFMDDRGAQGIQIINKKSELIDYLKINIK